MSTFVSPKERSNGSEPAGTFEKRHATVKSDTTLYQFLGSLAKGMDGLRAEIVALSDENVIMNNKLDQILSLLGHE